MALLADLIATAVTVEFWLIIGRVLISWFPGIPPWHPAVRFLVAVTDPVLMPFRRIIPTVGGLDFSPIVAIIALQAVGGFVVRLLRTQQGESVAYVLADAFRQLADIILITFVIIVFLRLLISFLKVSPFHPAVRLIREISSPLVRPFAGLGGRTAAADVPAIVAIVVYFIIFQVADHLLRQLVSSVGGLAMIPIP